MSMIEVFKFETKFRKLLFQSAPGKFSLSLRPPYTQSAEVPGVWRNRRRLK